MGYMMAIKIKFIAREKTVAIREQDQMTTLLDQFSIKKHKRTLRHVEPKRTSHGTTADILGRYQHN